MFENGKLVIPCTTCARDGVERKAGPGYVAGLRGMPRFLCPEHGGREYADTVSETIEGGN